MKESSYFCSISSGEEKTKVNKTGKESRKEIERQKPYLVYYGPENHEKRPFPEVGSNLFIFLAYGRRCRV